MPDKPAILIDESLPTGLKANICVVLGMTLGRLRADFIGPDLRDAGGVCLPGITNIPIPILGAAADRLRAVYAGAGDLPIRAPFTRAALETKDYASYGDRVTANAEHEVLGLLLCGPRKSVARLCGSLPLLR